MIQNVLILCALIAASLFSAALLKEIMDNKEISEERYNNLERSGKATYILLRRISEELKNAPKQKPETDEEKDRSVKDPSISEENIINAQKAAARVIVSRNQENIREALNSNNKVLDKCSELEDKIDGFKTELLEMEKSIFELMRQDISDQKEEQLEEQSRIADEIKDSIEEAARELSSDIRAYANKVDTAQRPKAQEIDPSSLGESENLLDDILVEDEVPAIDTETVEEIPTIETEAKEEPDIETETVEEEQAIDTEAAEDDEEVDEEDASMLEGLAMLEEIEKLGNDEPDDDADSDDDVDSDDDDGDNIDEDTELEFEKLDPPEIILTENEEPDFSNPNKMMTPDEIAALLAKM